jgi:hypothetical protein
VPSEPNTEVNVEGLTNELDAAGIARINGLAALLPAGATTFGAGNIIIGGSGSDEIWGNGADDIIDGDKWLNVRLSVRDAQGAETRTVTTLSELQADIMAGTIDPGNVEIVREILSTPGAGDIDTAVFSGAMDEYDISTVDGVTTVAHTGGTGDDGTDRITNVERLRFTDQTVNLTAPVVQAPAAPVIGTAVAGDASATVAFTAPSGGSPAESFSVEVRTGTTVVRTIDNVPGNATSHQVTGLTNGTAYNFQVRAVNAVGESPWSAPSNEVTPRVPAYVPPAVSPFTDVPTDHTFYREIAWLADQGISNGWPGANNTATFRPAENVNRDQMAAFLYRMSGTTDYTAPAVSPFTDVPTSHTFYKEIAWLADQGISNGWPGANNTATFRPAESINRDQMAAFLYRMSNPTAG